jgi:hypothetical protein
VAASPGAGTKAETGVCCPPAAVRSTATATAALRGQIERNAANQHRSYK